MHTQRLRLPFFAMLVITTVLMLSQAQAGGVRLTLVPPTTNADGTPLKDLAGYQLHWGQASRSYHATKQVGKEVTSVTITGLSEGKTYFFAVRAFDSAGNESKYSNEMSITIPLGNTAPNDGNFPVRGVTASAWQVTNEPDNTHDGDLNTRWAAEGDGQWIAYDLGSQMMVSQVALAWHQGNQQQAFFAIEVSPNGTDWTEVYSGESSGETLDLEPYNFTAVLARYVRILGYGNTQQNWNSMTEVEIAGSSN